MSSFHRFTRPNLHKTPVNYRCSDLVETDAAEMQNPPIDGVLFNTLRADLFLRERGAGEVVAGEVIKLWAVPRGRQTSRRALGPGALQFRPGLIEVVGVKRDPARRDEPVAEGDAQLRVVAQPAKPKAGHFALARVEDSLEARGVNYRFSRCVLRCV